MSDALNGVNVNQLLGTIDAVKNEPSMADFKFKAKINERYSRARSVFFLSKQELSQQMGSKKAGDYIRIELYSLY